MPELSSNISDNNILPVWLNLLGRCHRRFKLVQIAKKILYRSGIDLNRFISGHQYIERIKIYSGLPIALHLDDHIDNIIWWNGYYEKHPTRIFLKLTNPGDCVVDVGANIGYYSVLAASRIGSAGKIFAFEPVLSIYQRLLENVSELKNIKPEKVACGNTTGEIKIYVADDTCSAGSRISQPIENHPLKIETVPIIKLDNELMGEKVDLLKIDVEGYETEVLRGAVKLIRTNPQIKIFIEISKKLLEMAGSSPEEIFNLLTGLGLQPWKVELIGDKYLLLLQKDYWKDENLILFAKKEYLPHELLGE